MSPLPRRARRVALVGVTALALGAACGGAPTTSRTGGGGAAVTGAATLPDPGQPAGVSLTGLQDGLDARVHAALAGDRDGWLAMIDPAAGALRRQQGETYAALRRLRPARLDYRVDEGTGAPVADRPGEVTVRVVGEWSPRGLPDRIIRHSLNLRIHRTSRGWLIRAMEVPDGAAQVFDLPGVRVHASNGVVVLGNAPEPVLTGCAALATAARARAESAWARSTSTPVVVAPSTRDEFTRLTGRRSHGAGVAAVTYGEVTTGSPARGDLIVVNPETWAGMTAQGRRVVLVHEMVHLLVRATTTHHVPQWLSEGYAVRASYAGLEIDPTRAAAGLVRRVREGHLPGGLPGDERFEGAGVGESYDEAWLAVEHLTRVQGAERVRRFYEDLADGVPASQAWARLGTTEEDLVRGWQADLRALSGAGRQESSPTGPP